MLEIWLPVPIKEYSKDYKVSNFGRVMSLNYKRTGKTKVLRNNEMRCGYLCVKLSKNRKEKTFLVHRLVAEAFIPNPENKPEVNHKIEGDEGKTMNFVFFNEDGTIDKERTTIEWCTSEENKNYGTRKQRVSEKMTNGKQSKPVLQYTKTGELIREWPSIQEAGRNGFSPGNVVNCCRGKLPHYKGYIWKYKEP